MDFEKEDIDNLSETMSESSDEKPEKYVDSDDDNESEVDDLEEDLDEDGIVEAEVEDPDFNEGFNERDQNSSEDSSDDNEDDDEYDEVFDKIDKSRQESIIQNHHPELKTLNYEEIETLCVVVRDTKGIVIDPLHKTLPILSRYEKARILGERAEQINSGAQPFIEVESSMIDGYLIAMKELDEKKIPFIIQRPLPNGGCEYWRLSDLEIIS
jgi:DNA-directed RNA polymerase I, II, and III subunit RPABC2